MGAKKDIYEIRNNLHEWVYDYLKESCDRYHELHSALSPTARKNACKMICIVSNTAAADEIKAQLVSKIVETNAVLHRIGESNSIDISDIKYKIEVINATDNIMLNTLPAQRRVSSSGAQIIPEIQAYIKRLEEDTAKNRLKIQEGKELLSRIDSRKIYTVASDSGNSYRVSYFDCDDNCRRQCSVGDVLIVVGTDIEIVDAPHRKSRSDRAEPFGMYIKQVFDQEYYYQIYPFNEKYLNRRTQRLSNK